MTTRQWGRTVWPKAYVTYDMPGASGSIEITDFIHPPTTESLIEIRQLIVAGLTSAPDVARVRITNWLRMGVS